MFELLKRRKYSTGIIAPDYPDSRDYMITEIVTERKPLPKIFNLINHMPPVEYQNGKGICYSYAVSGIKEYLDTIEKYPDWEWQIGADGRLMLVQQEKQWVNLSERFIVHNTKKISGLWNIQGDYFRNALKAITKYGAPLEEEWKTDLSLDWNTFARTEPPQSVYQEAETYKAGSYWRVPLDIEAIKQTIYQQKSPLLVGMMWNRAYYKTAKDGKLSLPTGKNVGGHAVVIVGWENDKIWFRNSWGEKWGYHGYFYIPESEFSKHQIWDIWALTDIIVPEETNEGWVAVKYLKLTDIYKKGQLAKTTARLRMRHTPEIRSDNIIKTLKKGEMVRIISDDYQVNNGYVWQKVKVVEK